MPGKNSSGSCCPGIHEDAVAGAGGGEREQGTAGHTTATLVCILKGQLLNLSLLRSLFYGDSRESLFLKNK